jgi:ferredoxin-NADP reductase
MTTDSAQPAASLSDVRTARLRAATDFASSRWLQFEITDQRAFAFRGGQYVIVDTGLLLPDGRPRRRAYSMLSQDQSGAHFELGVFRLAGGLGCNWLHQLALNGELHFSGPWGKLAAPGADARGPVWVIATDSGPSAALGLCHGRSFEPHRARTELQIWTPSPDYFLDHAFIRSHAATCAALEFRTLGPIGSERRLAQIHEWALQLLARHVPEHVYLLGDGAVTRSIVKLLLEHGVDPARIQVETFFNHVERKPNATRAA